MGAASRRNRLANVGLVLLAVVAIGLSVVAVVQHRGATPTSAAPQPSTTVPAPVETTPVEPGTNATTDPAGTTPDGPAVVVIGDGASVGDSWVTQAAAGLGWGDVTNLSTDGRGFVASPTDCGFEPCANFIGSIDAIVEASPDVVVTFGGTVDGDYSLEGPAADYFEALRAALPEAEIVAIAPIATDAEAPYWLTLHKRTITFGVESVDGRIVDVGQPALGNGDTITPDAYAEIARVVVEQLAQA